MGDATWSDGRRGETDGEDGGWVRTGLGGGRGEEASRRERLALPWALAGRPRGRAWEQHAMSHSSSPLPLRRSTQQASCSVPLQRLGRGTALLQLLLGIRQPERQQSRVLSCGLRQIQHAGCVPGRRRGTADAEQQPISGRQLQGPTSAPRGAGANAAHTLSIRWQRQQAACSDGGMDRLPRRQQSEVRKEEGRRHGQRRRRQRRGHLDLHRRTSAA